MPVVAAPTVLQAVTNLYDSIGGGLPQLWLDEVPEGGAAAGYPRAVLRDLGEVPDPEVNADDLQHGGSAQAGAASTITLDAGASATDDFYRGMQIVTTSGTGSGQNRSCTAYNGTTKVATVAPGWSTTPDVTTTFVVLGGCSLTSVVRGFEIELFVENDSDSAEALALLVLAAFTPTAIRLTFDLNAVLENEKRYWQTGGTGERSPADKPIWRSLIRYFCRHGTTY